jgi:hypothetical protein
MKLYHGSILAVRKPILLTRQRLLDFGKGFYTTTNLKQAERWAQIKKARSKDTYVKAVVTVYDFPDLLISDGRFIIKKFLELDVEWLDFIFQNRKGLIDHGYDIVMGPVANDVLYTTITLYEAGILNKNETIIRLKVNELFDQVSFHNTYALEELKYIDSYEI